VLSSQEAISPTKGKTDMDVINGVSSGVPILEHIPSDSRLRLDSISLKSSVMICVAYMVYGPSNSGQTMHNCSLVDRFPNSTATDVG
jgi:hypothetical protein